MEHWKGETSMNDDKPMSNKTPEMRNAIEGMFPGTKAKIDAGKCPTCGEPAGSFRDDISRKEFAISGMCQECQDSVFGGDPTDD